LDWCEGRLLLDVRTIGEVELDEVAASLAHAAAALGAR
jgi:hypothetical protein